MACVSALRLEGWGSISAGSCQRLNGLRKHEPAILSSVRKRWRPHIVQFIYYESNHITWTIFQVSHNFSGKINPDGTIDGIPESWKKRLQLMVTAEEAENPEIAEKAKQIFKWIDNRHDNSQEFMRVNSSPANSTVLSSNSSHTSDEGFQSISDSLDDSDLISEEKGEEEEREAGDEASSESARQNRLQPGGGGGADKAAAGDTEVPTLRRKKKTKNGPAREGPRVTRNITDDEVVNELRDICTGTLPWEKYQKVTIFRPPTGIAHF